MGEQDFWNQHSLNFLEMAYKADHRERVRHPDGYGSRIGECGDKVEFLSWWTGDGSVPFLLKSTAVSILWHAAIQWFI